jgi:hypothetical protein
MREKQIWLPMWKMKAKVPRGRARPTHFSAQISARQSDQGRPGGVAPAGPQSAQEREIIVSRVRRFSPWLLGVLLAAAALAPASGQNLDAGKPASQIFAEVCANCHRSPRELKSNPGTSFLREHYTTGSDMASTMSAYLSSAGTDPRAPGAPQPKRLPPANVPSPVVTTPPKDVPAADPSRDPRRAQQAADPKALPDPKAVPAPPGLTRNRPATARVEGAAETKPPAPPAPTRPVLEDFEE